MLKVPVERPVEPLTIALLRDVKDACAQLGTRFVLAGATARDILTWHLHDIKAPVATLLGGFVDDSDTLLAIFTKELLSTGRGNEDRADVEPEGPVAGA